MIGAEAAAELAAGRVGILLVTVNAGGIRFLAASRPADVPWANGVLQSYQAIARLEGLEASIDVASLTGIGSYQSIKVDLADEDVDAVSLQLAGHPIAGAEVEIALWWPGQDWEQRRVLLSGRVRSPTLQGSGRMTGFTASAVPSMAGSGVVCEAERDVAGEYTPIPAQGHAGEAMPAVLGRVRNMPGIKVGTVGVLVDYLLLAGHYLPAGQVNVYEDGSTTPFSGSPFDVVSELSESGTKVATLHNSAGAGLEWQNAGALTVDCEHGGAPRVDGSGGTRTAADVIVWLLRASGRRIDWRRMQQALAHLATWEIGVYLDTEVAAIDALNQGLLSVLPLVALEGGDGLWYHYADLDLRHPTMDLVEGQNLLGPAPGTGLDWSSDEDCQTSFSLSWYYDHAVSECRQATTIDHASDPMCFLGKELVGARSADPLQSVAIWAATMARRSLLHQARRRCLPFGTARFVVDPDVAVDADEGSTVLVTWSPWGLSRRPMILRSARPAGDVAEITVTVVPCLTLRDGRL